MGVSTPPSVAQRQRKAAARRRGRASSTAPGWQRPLRRAAERFGVVIALLLLWQWWAVGNGSFFFPPPANIAERMYEIWFSEPASSLFLTDAFRADVVPSMLRALAGWTLGATVGITLGMVAGRWARARDYVDPPVNFLRALPKPAIVPMFLLVLGATDGMRVLLIAFGCVWPVLLNTMQGARAMDPVLQDTGRVFRISVPRQFVQIALPAAAPKISAGLRVTLSLSLILMVLSEWILADNGLGHFLIEAQHGYRLLDMWAALLLLALVGYSFNTAFLAAERRLLGWHAGATGRAAK